MWPAPAVQRSPHPRPQDFEYTVTVEDGPRKKSVVLHKPATTAGMRELIAFVEEHGRPSRINVGAIALYSRFRGRRRDHLG